MINGRCGYVMVFVVYFIFVIGGRDGWVFVMINIEEFNLQIEKWFMVGDFYIGVRLMFVLIIGEKIFIFGGIIELDKDMMLVQCFDIRFYCISVIGDFLFMC